MAVANAVPWRLPRCRRGEQHLPKGVFLLEGLLAARRKDRKNVEFLSHWLRYHPVFDTWESEGNVLMNKQSDDGNVENTAAAGGGIPSSTYEDQVNRLKLLLDIVDLPFYNLLPLTQSGDALRKWRLAFDIRAFRALNRQAMRAMSQLDRGIYIKHLTPNTSSKKPCSRILHNLLTAILSRGPISQELRALASRLGAANRRAWHVTRLQGYKGLAFSAKLAELLNCTVLDDLPVTTQQHSSPPAIRKNHALVDVYRLLALPRHPDSYRKPKFEGRYDDPLVIRRLYIPPEFDGCVMPEESAVLGCFVPYRIRRCLKASNTGTIVYEVEMRSGRGDGEEPSKVALLSQNLIDSLYPWLRDRYEIRKGVESLIKSVNINFILVLPSAFFKHPIRPICGFDCWQTHEQASEPPLCSSLPDLIAWWQYNIPALKLATTRDGCPTNIINEHLSMELIALDGPARLISEFVRQLWSAIGFISHNSLGLVEAKSVCFFLLNSSIKSVLGTRWSLLRRIASSVGCNLTYAEQKELDKLGGAIPPTAPLRVREINEVVAWPCFPETAALLPEQAVDQVSLLYEHLQRFRLQVLEITGEMVPKLDSLDDRIFHQIGATFPLAMHATPHAHRAMTIRLIEEIAFATFLYSDGKNKPPCPSEIPADTSKLSNAGVSPQHPDYRVDFFQSVEFIPKRIVRPVSAASSNMSPFEPTTTVQIDEYTIRLGPNDKTKFVWHSSSDEEALDDDDDDDVEISDGKLIMESTTDQQSPLQDDHPISRRSPHHRTTRTSVKTTTTTAPPVVVVVSQESTTHTSRKTTSSSSVLVTAGEDVSPFSSDIEVDYNSSVEVLPPPKNRRFYSETSHAAPHPKSSNFTTPNWGNEAAARLLCNESLSIYQPPPSLHSDSLRKSIEELKAAAARLLQKNRDIKTTTISADPVVVVDCDEDDQTIDKRPLKRLAIESSFSLPRKKVPRVASSYTRDIDSFPQAKLLREYLKKFREDYTKEKGLDLTVTEFLDLVDQGLEKVLIRSLSEESELLREIPETVLRDLLQVIVGHNNPDKVEEVIREGRITGLLPVDLPPMVILNTSPLMMSFFSIVEDEPADVLRRLSNDIQAICRMSFSSPIVISAHTMGRNYPAAFILDVGSREDEMLLPRKLMNNNAEELWPDLAEVPLPLLESRLMLWNH